MYCGGRGPEKFIDKILSSRLPAKVLPYYLKEEKAKLPDITEWQLYNDPH